MDTITCICGNTYLKCNTNRHLKSKQHIYFMNDPIKIRIKQERSKRAITCVCGSKYEFQNDMRREAHERSRKHWKFLNYKL
jgi:hypothetical protein